jgi:hypothetical protein
MFMGLKANKQTIKSTSKYYFLHYDTFGMDETML